MVPIPLGIERTDQAPCRGQFSRTIKQKMSLLKLNIVFSFAEQRTSGPRPFSQENYAVRLADRRRIIEKFAEREMSKTKLPTLLVISLFSLRI